MADDFRSLFGDHLSRSGKTQTEFADLVGTTQPTVALILAGKRTPRPAALPRWADVLNLTGDARARFIEAGQSARAASHQAVAPYVKQLEDDLDEAHRVNAAQHDQLAALNQSLAQMGSMLADLAGVVVAHRDRVPQELLRRALEILERVEPQPKPGETA